MFSYLDELASHAQYGDCVHADVSGWSIGEHLEHIVLANTQVAERLLANCSEQPEKGEPLSLIGRIVLFTGYIPRGKGRAPESVIPRRAADSSFDGVLRKLRQLDQRLDADADAIRRSRYAFPHPVFGLLSPTQWIRFANFHTRHHLKIIREIRAVTDSRYEG